MNYKEVVDKRRAVNFFDTEKDVTEDKLKEMITLASKTPSSFNLQPWNLMILRDMERKSRLQKLAWDQPKVSEAPVTLIVLADMDGWKDGHETVEKNWKQMLDSGSMNPDQKEWFLGAAKSLYGNNKEENIAFAVKNTGFFGMSLMYAATSLGLETHPMDGFDREEVRKEFGIPDNYWIPLLLSVGYLKPGIELHPPKWRKSLDDIVVNF